MTSPVSDGGCSTSGPAEAPARSAARSGRQVERGHRGTGPGEQGVQVAQALAVPQPDLASAVGQRPHLPVPVERMVGSWNRNGRGLPLDARGQRQRAHRAGARDRRGPVPRRGFVLAERVGQQGQVMVHGPADGRADPFHHDQPGVGRQRIVGPARHRVRADQRDGLGDLRHRGQPLRIPRHRGQQRNHRLQLSAGVLGPAGLSQHERPGDLEPGSGNRDRLQLGPAWPAGQRCRLPRRAGTTSWVCTSMMALPLAARSPMAAASASAARHSSARPAARARIPRHSGTYHRYSGWRSASAAAR